MILIRVDYGCQLACDYCYARSLSLQVEPNVEKVLESVAKLGDDSVCIHGREPLLAPHSLIKALSRGVRKMGMKFGVQTNGLALLNEDIWDKYLPLFDFIGVSWDGFLPGGILRHKTEEGVRKVLRVIEKLAQDHSVGVIMVLSEKTTTDSLKMSLEALVKAKVKDVRLNPVHSPYPFVPNDYLIELYRVAFPFQADINLSPFTPQFKKDCSRNGCSPLGTRVPEVLLDGTLANCPKGVITVWEGVSSFREDLLRSMPQENGGCKGCEIFGECKGGCPATSPDGYTRSYYCPTWKEIFGHWIAVQK